ncbi:26S proteasome non-ATPase regulatory subunit 1 [Fukomys damarensis]|uniref:26S proteasome non-ATPase regulatory subunit 1 n=1 Tax=Fukomys damarensis TaxID=885580 RepID=A0A091CV07_FUKDA|nr:26S proteasome non-ATPase regulatory subunit 1 [Fukomys damarensis]
MPCSHPESVGGPAGAWRFPGLRGLGVIPVELRGKRRESPALERRGLRADRRSLALSTVDKGDREEVLYEDEGFRSRQFAALVASKVFYHLGAFEESLNYALGAGDLFNVNDNSEYVETIIAKCIDHYTKQCVENADLPEGEKKPIDQRLEGIVNKMFQRCLDDHRYKQAIGIALETRRLDVFETTILESNDVPGMLAYSLKLCMSLMQNKQFRNKVLRVLVKIYMNLEKPDFINVCQCLIFLDDPQAVSDILEKLVKEDNLLMAYQICFDLYESASQQFLSSVIQNLGTVGTPIASVPGSTNTGTVPGSEKDGYAPRAEAEKTFSYPLYLLLKLHDQRVLVAFGQRDGIRVGHAVLAISGVDVNGKHVPDGKEVLEYLSNPANYPVSIRFGRPRLTSNERLMLASMFHSLFAIGSQLSPEQGSSGIEILETDTFKLHCFQTLTGIKFVVLADPRQAGIDSLLRKIGPNTSYFCSWCEMMETEDKTGNTLVGKTPDTSPEPKDQTLKMIKILSGEMAIELHLQFLIRNNNTDLMILKNTKSPEPKDQTLKMIKILSGEMAIELHLQFLIRNNNTDLMILKNTKGHEKEALQLMATYLPKDTSPGSAYQEGGGLYALGLIHANHGGDIIDYLLNQLKNASNDIVRHGGSLGLGLAAMGTARQDVYDLLKTNLYQDDAVTGEAAGLALGLVMLGSKNAQAIEDMVGYAQETQHEKILRGLAVGIALVMYGRMEEADALIESLCRDKDPILRRSGMYTVAMAYCGSGNNKAIRRLLHVAHTPVKKGPVPDAASNSYYSLIAKPPGTPELLLETSALGADLLPSV